MKITKEKMQKIEKHVEKILGDKDFSNSPYVDIVSIVEKEGFSVITSLMPIETTGCIFVEDDKNERIIIVNKVFKNPDNEIDCVFKKSRFITAHEYGHYILHKQENKLLAHRDSDKRDTEREIEADYFARSLLMPLQQFKAYSNLLDKMGNDNEFTVELLSRIFKVTRNKVKARLEDLVVLY